jgi:hypothetical protein
MERVFFPLRNSLSGNMAANFFCFGGSENTRVADIILPFKAIARRVFSASPGASLLTSVANNLEQDQLARTDPHCKSEIHLPRAAA